jgi:hypothetical protein
VSEQHSTNDLSRIARERPDEPQALDPSELSRYDLLLAVIPLALLAAWGVGQAFALPTWIALGAGAIAALPALVDGLALNPPV